MERLARVIRDSDAWLVEVDTATGRQHYRCVSEDQAQGWAALFLQPVRTPSRSRRVAPNRPSGLVARMSRALGRDPGSD